MIEINTAKEMTDSKICIGNTIFQIHSAFSGEKTATEILRVAIEKNILEQCNRTTA